MLQEIKLENEQLLNNVNMMILIIKILNQLNLKISRNIMYWDINI